MFKLFQAPQITLSPRQHQILEELKNGTHVPQHLAQRATIILLAAEGQTNADIARTTKSNRNTVKEWRKRWAASAPRLDKTEGRVGGVLTNPVPSSNRTCGFPSYGSPKIVAPR